MSHREAEAARWFRQALWDAKAARANRDAGFFDLACFLCQQSGEKFLKSYLYWKGEAGVTGHSTLDLLLSCLRHDGRFRRRGLFSACKALDKHYIPTRYPNGLAGGIPKDVYGRDDADQALRDLAVVKRRVSSFLGYLAT
jgi:HEPN domain-containing protein